jgi:hypothetical protein
MQDAAELGTLLAAYQATAEDVLNFFFPAE